MTSPDTVGPRLPDETFRYLAQPSLTPLWTKVRAKLERGRLAATGTVTVVLDDEGADRLRGLLGAGAGVRPGTTRVRLDVLDAALRRSAAAAGLATVVAELTGPLVDRGAVRDASREQWNAVWRALDAALDGAGVADAAWVPGFVDGVRRAGLLTRAGGAAAANAVEHAGRVLAALDGALDPDADIAEPRWELAELASHCTGDAHGLDDGRLVGALVLRAASAALALPPADGPAQRRHMWTRLGVTPDRVSGTVLGWALRPPGADPWSAMLRTRADLGLVTHLTVQELDVCAGVPLAAPGGTVSVCENPQVLQAAARADVGVPLLCLAGNPASAGWTAVRRLLDDGVVVRYHGDFDWPGVAIAGRLYAAGVRPWRMDADAYLAAVDTLPDERRLALDGVPVATPWDQDLADAMRRTGVAVHEESLLTILLADLDDRAASADPAG